MLQGELLRALKGRPFWLACGLGAFACYIGLRSYFEGPAYIPGASRFIRNPYIGWFFTEAGPSSIFVLLAPLFAALPFADSYAADKNSGYLKFILLRTAKARYCRAKFIANALAGGLALFVPLMGSFIWLWIRLPHGLPPDAKSWPLSGPLDYIFLSTPALYVFFLIGLAFVFGAVYATLGLALSSVFSNRYVVIATPFLLYNIGNVAIAVFGHARWTPPTTLVPYSVTTTNSLTVFAPLITIFLFSYAVWRFMSRKEVIV